MEDVFNMLKAGLGDGAKIEMGAPIKTVTDKHKGGKNGTH